MPLRGEQLHRRMAPMLASAGGDGRCVGVLLLGLQGLRQFNIQHGYERGQRLVAQVEALVREALRPGDQVLGVAPGEWMLLLPGLRDGLHAQLAAARLLRQFEPALDILGLPVLANVAVGIALCPEHGRDGDELCRRTEAALMLAQAHPDRFAMCPATPLDAGLDAAELREALAQGQLEAHLQPLWDLREGRVCGAEALARWRHPGHGLVSPGRFIALAESTGLLPEFTRWSIHAALQHAVSLRAQGRPMPVSVNLSGGALADRGLVDQVLSALALWSLPPSDLVVEITETAIVGDLERGAHLLGALHAAGVRVAIDDFGVGNASFAYLRQFPASELKIDRSFVTGMLADMRSQQLVKAMVDFSHHLGIRVVAEGVEDRATLQALAAMGCDFAQGYAVGRPVPAAEFIAAQAA